MGRYKKYQTPAALEKKIEAYFNSISRTITKMEQVETGEYTQKGKPICKWVPICNDDGEEIRVKQFVIPPSISALCLYLGISRETWSNYAGKPEFLDSTTRARARVEAFLEGELVTREKGTDGIKFNLQHNFDWKEKIDVSSHQSVENFLREHPGGGGDEF